MHEDDQKEEEWRGISGEQVAEAMTCEHRTGAKPNKPLTGQELRAIKDATDLFKSSSFKLQIDALLPNVRPKPSRVPPLERFLFALHSVIMGIPSTAPQHPLEGARKLLKKGVAVPYCLPLPIEETNWRVAFDPPSDIILVGSWANKISVKPKDDLKLGVDLAVEMPDNLFQEKDYLNGRFFHKRSFYLATIAAAIQNPKSKLDVDVSYESWLCDPRLTKLVLIPRNNDSQTDFTKLNARICVLPIVSSTSPIPTHRLHPSRANIRANVVNDTTNTDIHPSNNPTPMYNNAILRNFTPKSQLLAVHTLQKDCAAFADALALLRIWANQRGYSEGTRMCVRGFEGAGPWWWSVLALLLTGEEPRPGTTKVNKRNFVGKGVSSYQLFKASLEFLAKHDFEKDHVFIKTSDGHRLWHEEYSECREAVFVDSSSFTNLLAGVPLGSLDLLRYDATKTLESLNHTSFSGDPFVGVFLKDSRDLTTRFDVILRVSLSSAKLQHSSIYATLDFGSPQNALLSSLASIIRRGLGNRSRAVTVLHSSSASRPTSQAHPSTPDVIFIGIIHNPQHAFHLVDHGPTADDQDQVALEQFRDFWGDKSELRRFKDGRIVESVVWEVTTADEMAHVPSMIVRHLLNRHFNIGEGDVETWQTSFDSVLRLPQSISQEYLASKISTGFKGALTAFDGLVKAIKKLDDKLPLTLLNVSPTSEFLRYTSIFSPVPLPTTLAALLPKNAQYLAPMDIMIEFEKSSKWPDDLKAIQTIKLAFFERLASALMESVDGLKANVVISDRVHTSEILDKAYLEIIIPDGWAFSAHIWHDREVHLLDRIISGNNNLPHIVVKNKTNKKSAEYFEALEAKEVYLRRFIHAPRHHRVIAALYHHYPAFSGTVRLVKRWLASHWLLQSHISEEVVEIICASFFVDGGRASTVDMDTEQSSQHIVPGSKERGFSAVVQFLKDWKWEDGLVVPLYGPAPANLADASTPSATIATHKGVWRVSTEHDKEGRVWTCDGPDLVVAHRVRSLADATWNYLQTLERAQIDIKVMFLHSTGDYDFIVQLDPTILPRYFHNINADDNFLLKRGKYANKPNNEKDMAILPGFDPARFFFDDLQRMYADTFKIFHDPFGGDRFGVVWDPSLKEPRPFRVLGGFSSQPIKKENDKLKDKALVNLNQDGIISEIERLGAGLIQKITIQS